MSKIKTHKQIKARKEGQARKVSLSHTMEPHNPEKDGQPKHE